MGTPYTCLVVSNVCIEMLGNWALRVKQPPKVWTSDTFCVVEEIMQSMSFLDYLNS